MAVTGYKSCSATLLYIAPCFQGHSAIPDLVGDLESLDNQDTKYAAVTLQMFKMYFMAASLLPKQDEMALVSRISRLMVDSFPLAAKYAEPAQYYLLLRALFHTR
jgi:transformation/transcription domain-associated protein